jgi:alpha-L-arabinofuranosidase
LTVSIDSGAQGKAISPDLVGIFFEDLSYAADGGLYAELVENRSFEYSAVEQPDWNSLTGWQLVERDGGRGMMVIDTSVPLHPNNPHYLVLGVDDEGGMVGLSNDGFDGIVVRKGERYRLSVFARQLAYPAGTLTVRLETASGERLGEAKLPVLTTGWRQYHATIEATGSDDAARLVLLAGHPGRIGLDMISLFPAKTFKDRQNGLRADLAQTIADLQPKFVRFPGGCLVHGDGLDNFYRWKDTIGPVHERKAQRNIWRYHQTLGLGYYEYFLFCEDLGAEPLPVVPAAVSCQNSGASVTGRYGNGQQCVPMEDMDAYIQDVLDLIEWANGPADSEWGAKRAAAGHPKPFGLKYLGVGNEDHITDGFEIRFRMIYEAVKARHPEITVIGTTGPATSGSDYERGWAFATSLGLEVVDEHGYQSPAWFWENLERWDGYKRNGVKVYLGEYAAHDSRRTTTLRSALAEAAYLTSMERNGDVVQFASYAPLLANLRHTSWNPNLIYFDNKEIYPTISYQVQKLFSHNAGDTWLSTQIDGLGQRERFAASTVRDEETGDVIVKLVNGDGEAKSVHLQLSGAASLAVEAHVTVLADDNPDARNDQRNPDRVMPKKATMNIGPKVKYEAPAHSLTVIRMKRRQ